MTEDEIKAYARLALAKQKQARESFDRRRVAREFQELAERNVAALARSRMLGGVEGEWNISESDGCLTVMSKHVFVRHWFFPAPWTGGLSTLRYVGHRLAFARLGKARYYERHWKALAQKIAAEDARRQVYDNDEMPAGLVMAKEREELADAIEPAPASRSKSL